VKVSVRNLFPPLGHRLGVSTRTMNGPQLSAGFGECQNVRSMMRRIGPADGVVRRTGQSEREWDIARRMIVDRRYEID